MKNNMFSRFFKISVFFCFATILVSGCSSKNKDKKKSDVETAVNNAKKEGPYILNLEKIMGSQSTHNFVINDIAFDIKYTPLETSEESLFLNYNYNFAKLNNYYFISGGSFFDTGKGILVFNNQGNFIKEIIKKGRGPGELPFIFEWYANEQEGTICATGSKQTIVYNTNLGKYHTVPVDLYIVPLKNNTYIYKQGLFPENTNAPHLIFINDKGESIHSLSYTYEREIEYKPKEGGSLTNTPPVLETYELYPNYKGDVLFKDVFNDTIYYVKNDFSITPHIILQRGKLAPTYKQIFNDEAKSKQKFLKNIMETESYVLLKYIYEKQMHCEIWDKETCTLIDHMEMDDNVIARHKKHFVKLRQPDDIISEIDIVYAKADKLYGILEAKHAATFLSNVKEEDNPVIVEITLNK